MLDTTLATSRETGRAGPRFSSGERAGPGRAVHSTGRAGPGRTQRAVAARSDGPGHFFLWATFYFCATRIEHNILALSHMYWITCFVTGTCKKQRNIKIAAFVILYIKGNVLAGPGRAGPRVGISTGRAGPGLVLAAVNGPGRAGPCATGRSSTVRWAGQLFSLGHFLFLCDTHRT